MHSEGPPKQTQLCAHTDTSAHTHTQTHMHRHIITNAHTHTETMCTQKSNERHTPNTYTHTYTQIQTPQKLTTYACIHGIEN